MVGNAVVTASPIRNFAGRGTDMSAPQNEVEDSPPTPESMVTVTPTLSELLVLSELERLELPFRGRFRALVEVLAAWGCWSECLTPSGVFP